MCSEAYRRIIVTFGLIPQMVLGKNLTCNALISSHMLNLRRACSIRNDAIRVLGAEDYGGTERFLSTLISEGSY